MNLFQVFSRAASEDLNDDFRGPVPMIPMDERFRESPSPAPQDPKG